jgi:hypothetical protein
VHDKFSCVEEEFIFVLVCVSDGLVILNKPYGIGLSPPPTMAAQHSGHTNNTFAGQSQYYLTEALPHIAGNLGFNSLTVLKIPERFVLFLCLS